MKQKYFAFFVFLVTFTAASAQQDPKKTHYMYDIQSYNPAYSGSRKNALCITSLYHQQWYGFRDADQNGDPGSRTGPSTQVISVNGRIPLSPHGLGLTIYNDGLGYERTTAFQASYAYHLRVGYDGQLGIGASAGLMQKVLDGTKYRPIDPSDPLVPATAVSDRVPDFSAGLFYTNQTFHRFFAGISATHLRPSTLTYQTIGSFYTNYDLVTTGYATAGASFPAMGGLLDIEPSVLIKSDFKMVQFDMNVGVWYNRVLRGALATSFNKGTFITGMVGYKFNKSLFISYSFDVITNRINDVSPNTHEVLINYCFIFKEGGIYLTPRFLGGSWRTP